MEHGKEVRVIIPPRTIITIVLTLLGLWAVYQVREVVLLFLVTLAVVFTFSPVIESWQKRMPRTAAILLLYATLFLGLVLLIAILLPPVINQFNDFLIFAENSLAQSGYTDDSFLQRIRENLTLFLHGNGVQAVAQLLVQFRGSVGTVYSSTVGALGVVIGIITVFIASFYLLAEEKNMYNFIGSLFPSLHMHRIRVVVDQISAKMGNWLRGQLLLMIIVGVLTSVSLAILGVPYALLLGIWAGLMEFLPYVGPIAGAVPGVLIAFSTLGFTKAVVAIIIYLVIQQIENQFLVPKIMGRALGLSPVVIIFALLIGGKLLGFLGLLIAIPIAAALSVVYEDWRKNTKED